MLTTGPHRVESRPEEKKVHSDLLFNFISWLFLVAVIAVIAAAVYKIASEEDPPQLRISRCAHQSCMERTVEVEGERCFCAHKLTGGRFTFEPEEAEED